jgi:rubrerythrin
MTSSVWDFLIIFFILFAVLTVIIVAIVFRVKPKADQEEIENMLDINQEKVIIKEIVKIRCRYCGFTYDQGLDSCPNCGAGT